MMGTSAPIDPNLAAAGEVVGLLRVLKSGGVDALLKVLDAKVSDLSAAMAESRRQLEERAAWVTARLQEIENQTKALIDRETAAGELDAQLVDRATQLDQLKTELLGLQAEIEADRITLDEAHNGRARELDQAHTKRIREHETEVARQESDLKKRVDDCGEREDNCTKWARELSTTAGELDKRTTEIAEVDKLAQENLTASAALKAEWEGKLDELRKQIAAIQAIA